MAIRTIKQYNLNDIMDTDLEGKWEMPIIYKDDIIPRDLIGFNYAKTSKSKDLGIHFYIDDYQFERVWVEPSKYVDMLSKYECILSPDFSLYLDMPLPMKIWNTYRGRYIGQYYQKRGIKCVPTLSWGDEDTFDFAFEGIEKNSIISVSTLGVMKSNQAKEFWEYRSKILQKQECRTIRREAIIWAGVVRVVVEVNPVQIMNRIKEGKLQNTKLERFTVLLKKGKSILSLK